MTTLNRPGQALSPEQIAQREADALAEEQAKSEAEHAAKVKEAEANKTPAELWKESITKVGLKESEARGILRQILKKGFWEKDYSLFQGELNISLRTRTSYSRQRVAIALDALQKPCPDVVWGQVMARLNLAGSLSKYDDVQLPHTPLKATDDEERKAFEERLEFLDKAVPEPVLSQLYEQLRRFDLIAMAVTAEGAVQGF